MVVVSGLAEGIDTAAHETAIEADGRTIAVLGTPRDRFYPKSNKALQERMMRDQLGVSHFQIGRGVGTSGFVMRNRRVALLTDEYRPAGVHVLRWTLGPSVASGTYLVRLTAGDSSRTRSFTRLR